MPGSNPPSASGGAASVKLLTAHISLGSTVFAGGTFYCTPGAPSASTTEAQRITLLEVGQITKLAWLPGSDNTAGDGAVVVTLRVNGVDTAFSVTLGAGAVASYLTSVATPVTVVAGDRLSLSVVNNNTGIAYALANSAITIAYQ